jgi:glycosyltransferase involved in cell wall biosynthesis
MTCLLSVLLPCRNAEKHLPRCLESLENQTFDDFEIVAVNDGSEDKTGTVLDDLQSRHRQVKIIHQQHRGIVQALNAGLHHCRGRWVARMDADDFALPMRLERQLAWMKNHPHTKLSGCLVSHGGHPQIQKGYRRHVEWINSMVTNKDISLNRFVESPFAHPSMIYDRRTVLDAGGYRDGPFPEDYDLVLRLLDQGMYVDKIPEHLLIWNDPPERLSRTHPKYSISAFYRLKTGYLAEWLEQNNPWHPDVFVMGSSRTVRQRAGLLTAHGINIRGYYDVDPRKVGRVVQAVMVLDLADLPGPGTGFHVSFLGKRGVRKELNDFFVSRGHQAGRDFIMAA